MKTPLPYAVGGFIIGVFVGAGQWFALAVIAASAVALRWYSTRPPPDPSRPFTQPQQRPGSPPGRFF
jgi:hypothetical protein